MHACPTLTNMEAVGWLTVVLLSAYGFGRTALWMLGLKPPIGIRLTLGVALGIGMLSLGMLGLGLLGLYVRSSALILLALGTIGSAYTGHHDLPEIIAGFRGLRWSTVGGGRYWFVKWAALGIGCWVLLQALVADALVPPLAWDEVAYHLALPKLYLQERRITFPPSVMQSLWPSSTEMLFTLSLLLGNEILPHLIVLFTSVLAMVAVYLLGARVMPPPGPWFATAFVAATPMVMRLSGIAFNDVPLAAYVAVSILALHLWVTERSPAYLIVSALLCGFALGTKLTGLVIGLIMSVWAGWLLVDRQSFRSAIRAALAFGGVSLAVALPWYIRSYVLTGNPVWPLAHSLLGGEYWDSTGSEYFLHWMTYQRPPLSLANILRMAWLVPRDYGGILNWAIMPLVVPFGVCVLPKMSRFVRGLAAILLAYYVFWAVSLGHQMRFLMPAVPVLAILGARTFGIWLARLPHSSQVALSVLMVGVLCWEVRPTKAHVTFLCTQRLPYVVGKLSREEFLYRNVDLWPVAQYAGRELPPDATLLLLPYETRGYYLDRAYVWGNPISQRYIRFERYHEVETLWAHLRDLGITHIIDNPNWVYTDLPHWSHDRALMLELEHECAHLLFEQNDIRLYEMSEACAG